MPAAGIRAEQAQLGTPVDIGTANAPGSASTFVASDHVHAHGAQTDPSLHALVDSSGNGFQPQSNRSAAVDPTVSDDSAAGYAVGSYWVNTTTDEAFICVDDTAGAAVWLSMTAMTGISCVQEALTAESITGTDTTLTDTLSSSPADPACVVYWLNGVGQEQGSGRDYTVGGTGDQEITILAGTGTHVDMVAADSLWFFYIT